VIIFCFYTVTEKQQLQGMLYSKETTIQIFCLSFLHQPSTHSTKIMFFPPEIITLHMETHLFRKKENFYSLILDQLIPFSQYKLYFSKCYHFLKIQNLLKNHFKKVARPSKDIESIWFGKWKKGSDRF
jgi:hypothetical protein